MSQSETFTFTGSEQTWTAPDGVDDVTVECWGAEGGAGYNNTLGDQGGYIKATISTTPGETLYLYVGEEGGDGDSTTGGPGGFPAGGDGGDADEGGGGGGGGGRSDVRQGGNATSDIVIAAGGGGGAGSAADGGYGGFGGYQQGEDGGKGRGASSHNGYGGGGGTQSSGGAGGSGPDDGQGNPGNDGSQWAGGAGGTDNTSGRGGGGGGDGYYGGGGGGSGTDIDDGDGGGGGGGSSTATVSVASSSDGVQSGDGKIVLTYEQTVDNLSVDATTGDSADLSWEDTFDSEDEYRVYRTQASSPVFPEDYTQVATLSANSTTYTDTGLEDGENYSWTVTAYNSTDGEFPEADPVSATTDLPAPTLDSIDDTVKRELTLTYTLNDDSTDGDVLIERSEDGGSTWSEVATIADLSATQYTDTGMLDGERYTYRLTRRTDHATAQSGTLAATTILPAPTNLTHPATTATTSDYGWDAQHNNGQTRVEYRESDASTWQTYTTVENTTETATVDGLLNGEEYDSRVVAETEHTETEDQ